MSRFYTSITRNGVNVVERYVENGEHKMNIEEFKPELFVTSLQSDPQDAKKTPPDGNYGDT